MTRVSRVTKILEGPLEQKYIKTTFTRGLETINMSKYLENDIVRSKRVMIQGPSYNKYMEMQFNKYGKYIKNSFFSSSNTVPRNLDYPA